MTERLQSERSYRIDEATQLRDRLLETAELMALAHETDAHCTAHLKELEDLKERAVAEVVVEDAAMGDDSQLAGLAKTSKAYQYAMASLINSDSTIIDLDNQISRAHAEALQTAVKRKQLEIQVSALKHACDLQAAILNTFPVFMVERKPNEQPASEAN